MFTILGLRLIPNIDGGEVDPTPTAAPVAGRPAVVNCNYITKDSCIWSIQ